MSARASSHTIVYRDRCSVGLNTGHRCASSVILRHVLTVLAIVASSGEAGAQVIRFWINSSGGSYHTSSNWNPFGVPGPNDGAEFGLPATYTVNFFADATVSDAFVSAGNVTWDLGFGTEFVYTVDAVEVMSGSQLTVLDGTLTANTMLISGGGDVVVLGADRNRSAHITVTGAGSSLTHGLNPNFVFLEVGKEVPGATMHHDETMMIQNGGTVTSGSGHIGADLIFGSAGTVDVIGAGSNWTTMGNLEVGDFSPGTLNISDGGTVSTPNVNNGNVGLDANGTVNVTGAGSAWIIGGNPMMISGNLSLGFNQGVTGTLNVTAGGAVSSTRGFVGFVEGSAFVTVSGTGSTWTNAAELTVAQNSAVGVLTIEAGGAVSNANAVIGRDGVFFDFPASDGAVTITGAGSTWTNSGDLTVGLEGIGTLNIENGGGVSNNVGYVSYAPDSEGHVTVSGAGSTWTNNGTLEIGRQGDGTLTITNGGAVTSGLGHIGGSNAQEPDTGTGLVTISGAGSTWTSDNNLHVGFRNTGMMTIQDGGSVSNMNGFLATFVGSTGTATVTGAGSNWTNIDSINIGNLGEGTLTIENGGSVTATDGHVAPSPGSMGTVVVRGAGSTWDLSAGLFLGFGGAGMLTIENGGAVSAAQGVTIANNGLVRLDGGTLTTSAISFQGAGQFQWNAGTLHVGTYNGNLENFGGVLAPGQSAGTTTILGNYTQHEVAKLEIEIGGTAQGTTYDFVNISGTAFLDGELQLAMLSGFQPTGADTFVVLNSSGILSGFSNVADGDRLDTIDDLGSFQVHYGVGSPFNPSQVVLSAFIPNPLPGDFNDDGLVDTADFVMWQKLNLGPAAYNTWRQHFGESLGSGSAADNSNAATPEPTSLVLSLFGVAAAAYRRRRDSCAGQQV